MKIIITENQYNNLTQEKIKNFLFKLWDRQQENGEEPNLGEIIYDVLDIKYGSEMDHKLVRPLWYEYNGGSEKVINKIKDQILGKVFKIKGEQNLTMFVRIDEITNVNYEYNEYVEVSLEFKGSILGGNVDFIGTDDYGNEGETEVLELGDIYNELEYQELSDFEEFLLDEAHEYFWYKFVKKYGTPFNIELDNKF